jgi:hypothetical protein
MNNNELKLLNAIDNCLKLYNEMCDISEAKKALHYLFLPASPYYLIKYTLSINERQKISSEFYSEISFKIKGFNNPPTNIDKDGISEYIRLINIDKKEWQHNLMVILLRAKYDKLISMTKENFSLGLALSHFEQTYKWENVYLNRLLKVFLKKHYRNLLSWVLLEFNVYPQLEKFEWNNRIQQTETKTDKLKAELGKYGFFELPKVKQLSEPNKQSLVELISIKQMPYGIAMFDYLGFCEYLDQEQGTKYKADQILSRLFNNNAKDGTSAKHYRRSLIKPLQRYKAGEYKETVKTDYQKLK